MHKLTFITISTLERERERERKRERERERERGGERESMREKMAIMFLNVILQSIKKRDRSQIIGANYRMNTIIKPTNNVAYPLN